jgi:hypothetical protein
MLAVMTQSVITRLDVSLALVLCQVRSLDTVLHGTKLLNVSYFRKNSVIEIQITYQFCNLFYFVTQSSYLRMFVIEI